MLRLWFNRTYATTWHLIRMLRANPDGRPLHVLGSHVDPGSPVLAACDTALLEPDLPAEQYVEWALAVAVAHRIDVLVPRQHLVALAGARDRFAAAGTVLLCPDRATVELFDDKAAAYAAAGALGVPVPPHRVVHDGDELRAAYVELAQLAEQVCMKPVCGVGGQGYRRLTTDPPRWTEDFAGDLRSLVRLDDACRALDAAGRRDVLVLPFLDGTEISVDVVADAGGAVHAALGRAHDPAGNGRRRRIVDDAPAREVAETLTRAHRIAYLSNTQIKYWQGLPYLIEVNTRAAGGLFQTELAGVNLPWDAVLLALGERPARRAPRFGAVYTEVATYAVLRPDVVAGPHAVLDPDAHGPLSAHAQQTHHDHL